MSDTPETGPMITAEAHFDEVNLLRNGIAILKIERDEARDRIAELEEYAKHAELPNAQPIDDGGPAFPVPEMHIGRDTKQSCDKPGMSLRDWFAGMAMQGFFAGRNNGGFIPNQFIADNLAPDCYGYADAMLAARKGTESELEIKFNKAMAFIESLVTAGGPHSDINGSSVIQPAYNLIQELRS